MLLYLNVTNISIIYNIYYNIIPEVYGLIPSTVNLNIKESDSINDTTSI
jgi:hypothetical protein